VHTKICNHLLEICNSYFAKFFKKSHPGLGHKGAWKDTSAFSTGVVGHLCPEGVHHVPWNFGSLAGWDVGTQYFEDADQPTKFSTFSSLLLAGFESFISRCATFWDSLLGPTWLVGGSIPEIQKNDERSWRRRKGKGYRVLWGGYDDQAP